MGWGQGIGIGWPNASAGISYVKKLINAFKARVSSYPNSIFEAEPYLDATLTELDTIGLLKKASLVITPNAYNEGILYDVVPNTTLGDMDVVRATTATRINSAGLIEVVPRNLFTNSNNFANASWNKQNTSITANSIISPDGTQNASKFIANSTNAFHAIYSGAGAYYGDNTYSVYAKKGEYNFLILQDQFSSAFYNTFNIDSGTIVGGTNGTITSVGNGWYRCSVKFTAPAGNVFPTITIAPTNGGASYLGNSTSGAYLYCAQIEQGSTATEYFPTTTRLNIPRIGYTNGSYAKSLLVEPQRTNLALNSDGNLSTYPTAINVTNASSSFNSFSNAIQFPNTGLALAYKSVVTTAQTYAISVFIKMDDNSVPILSASTTTGNMCLVIAGAVVTNNLKVESYGNNVYRLSGTATSGAVNINNGLIRYDTQVLKSFKITGIQLEAASYPTSYIPTVASSVTRNADVISNTNIVLKNSWTFFLNSRFDSAEPDYSAIYIIDLASSNIVGFYYDFRNVISYSGFAGNFGNALPLYQYNKCCYKYDGTNLKLFKNGILVFNEIRPNIEFKKIFIQGSNPKASVTKTKELVLFNTALTDTECINLTTL